MSRISPRKLRNGKLLSQEIPNRTDTHCLAANMENVNDNTKEQPRTTSPSPSIRETQRENEERVIMLQREMSSLKTMMEKLLEQISVRVRQVDAAPTTSSFAVQSVV